VARMTVADLIERLREYPPETNVVVVASCCPYQHPIEAGKVRPAVDGALSWDKPAAPGPDDTVVLIDVR
jgi:hypothetical protein